jgi:hypothetical protein
VGGELVLDVALTQIGITILSITHNDFASAIMRISVSGFAVAARIGDPDGEPTQFTLTDSAGKVWMLEYLAQITLEINSYDHEVTVGDITLRAGPYAEFAGAASLRLVYDSQTLFEMAGNISISYVVNSTSGTAPAPVITQETATISISAFMSLGLLGSLAVNGTIIIHVTKTNGLITGTQGFFVGLQVGAGTGETVQAAGFTLTALFRLEINLTGTPQDFTRNKVNADGTISSETETVSVPAWTVHLFAGGKLSVGGTLDLIGSFEFTFTPPLRLPSPWIRVSPWP